MSATAALAGVGILQAVVYLLFMRAVDLYEREPLRYVVPVFVWGFTVAFVVSLIFNTLSQVTISSIAGRQTGFLATVVFVAPVVEESIKGLAVLLAFVVSYLVARRRGAIEFSGVMDGIVYGSAVGFGFAIAEDLLYFANFGPETFVMRRIFGGFGHAAWTSLTGVGIGLAPWVRGWFLKVLLPLLGLSIAILGHLLFNLAAVLLGPLSYVFLFFVVLLYIVLIIVWLAIERRTIRSELRDEVQSGTITREEYAILPTYFRRTGYYLRLIFSGRFSDWLRSHRVHSAAVDLAFTKRLTRSSYVAASRKDRVWQLRRRIQELRGSAPTGP